MDILEQLENMIEKTINKNQENNQEISVEIENITKEEIDLAKKLDAIEEFTVDRFEGNIVVLEDRKNNSMIDVKKEELPSDIKEGDILKKVNGKYFIDNDMTEKTAERIKNKMNDLWN